MSYFIPFQPCLMYSFNEKMKEIKIIDKFLVFLEESGVGKIIQSEVGEYKEGRRPYNPYKLFAAIIYGFSKHSGSLRKLEESIIYDIRFMYFLGEDIPSYVTISKFLNNVVVKHQREIYITIVKQIIEKFKICVEDVFIDGTKIEANANKYKFVWKPVTFHKKLNEHIRELLTQYFDLPEKKMQFTSKEIGTYLSLLEEKLKKSGVVIKQGKGLRYGKELKDYFLLNKYLLKILEYEEKERICGTDRRSYYKTDKDATAMCLKEDYYSGLGSNMHAGYNIQIAVAKGIILDYYVGQERSDSPAFIPFLERMKQYYEAYPKNICADAGYGSFKNYEYLYRNKIGNYVKYNTWNQEVNGKYIDLYRFNEDGKLICLNEKTATELSAYNGRHPKSKCNSFFLIEDCSKCEYKEYCNRNVKEKEKNQRVFETSREFNIYKNIAKSNLLSTKGIELRVNRSAQAEGAFGVIKQDMEYDRIRRRGLEKVSAEIMLVCLGYVLRKLFKLFAGTAKMDYWIAPSTLTPEQMPTINLEKLLKKKKKTKSVNAIAKQSRKKK